MKLIQSTEPCLFEPITVQIQSEVELALIMVFLGNLTYAVAEEIVKETEATVGAQSAQQVASQCYNLLHPFFEARGLRTANLDMRVVRE